MHATTLSGLQEQLQSLRAGKYDIVRASAEAWKTLPWLALLADGRGDDEKLYNRTREQLYQDAYNYFWWNLGRQGLAGVNLHDGSIADRHGGEVSDFDLDFVPLEALDIDALLTDLEARIRYPIPEEQQEQVEEFYFKKLTSFLDNGLVLTPRAARVVRSIFPYFPQRELSIGSFLDHQLQPLNF